MTIPTGAATTYPTEQQQVVTNSSRVGSSSALVATTSAVGEKSASSLTALHNPPGSEPGRDDTAEQSMGEDHAPGRSTTSNGSMASAAMAERSVGGNAEGDGDDGDDGDDAVGLSLVIICLNFYFVSH